MPIAHNSQTGETFFLDSTGQWAIAQTSKNPETGESFALDGAQWVPIQAQATPQPETVTTPQTPEVVEDAPFSLASASEDFTNLTREALNTFTFGLSDIIAQSGEDVAQAVFGTTETAPDLTVRQRRRQFAEENPTAAIAASLIGGFANPVAQRAGRFITQASNLPGTLARSTIVGAGLAGTQGAGESEGDIQERLVQTGKSAALGATIGGAVPVVGGILRGAGSGLMNIFGRFSDKKQATVALRKTAEALERDGLTPSQALQRIDELGDEAALIDVGPNSRALAFSAFGIPSKGKKTIQKFLTDRQEGVRNPKTGKIEGGQIRRIQESVDDLIPSNFFNERVRLANLNESGRLYDQAFAGNQNIESKVIDRLLKTPSGEKAFANARATLRDLQTNLSKTDPELTAAAKEVGITTGTGVGRGLKLQFLDQVKKELFDLETLAKTPLGIATQRSRAITILRRKLTQEMDNIDEINTGGAYSKARGLAEDKFVNQEALEKGNQFMSKSKFPSPEELQFELQDMGPQQLHLFRIGAAQALKAKIGDTVSRADATKKLLDIPALEQKIDAAFGDPDLFRAYTKLLENEKELFRAVSDVLGNSKTAERLAAQAEAGLDPAILLDTAQQLARGNIFQGAANFGRQALNRLKIPPVQADELAEVLTSRNIEGLQKVLQPGPNIGRLGRDEALVRTLSQQAGSE